LKLGEEAVEKGTHRPKSDGILTFYPLEDEPKDANLKEQAIILTKSILAHPDFKPMVEQVTPI